MSTIFVASIIYYFVFQVQDNYSRLRQGILRLAEVPWEPESPTDRSSATIVYPRQFVTDYKNYRLLMTEMQHFFSLLSKLTGPITRDYKKSDEKFESFWAQFDEFAILPGHLAAAVARLNLSPQKPDNDAKEQQMAKEYLADVDAHTKS